MQWHSQDIAVARAQHGHTTFVRTSARSAEAYMGGGLGASSPRNFTASQVCSEAIYRSEVYGKVAYDEHMRLVIRCYT